MTKKEAGTTSQPATAAKRFGALLQRDREHAGLSQRELAERAGLTGATAIGNLEKGMYHPSIETLAQLGTVFNWDFNYIMTIFGAPASGDVVRSQGMKQLNAVARRLNPLYLGLLTGIGEGFADKLEAES